MLLATDKIHSVIVGQFYSILKRDMLCMAQPGATIKESFIMMNMKG